jgi:hypothetical protein
LAIVIEISFLPPIVIESALPQSDFSWYWQIGPQYLMFAQNSPWLNLDRTACQNPVVRQNSTKP